jgi:hypothetical protein
MRACITVPASMCIHFPQLALTAAQVAGQATRCALTRASLTAAAHATAPQAAQATTIFTTAPVWMTTLLSRTRGAPPSEVTIMVTAQTPALTTAVGAAMASAQAANHAPAVRALGNARACRPLHLLLRCCLRRSCLLLPSCLLHLRQFHQLHLHPCPHLPRQLRCPHLHARRRPPLPYRASIPAWA